MAECIVLKGGGGADLDVVTAGAGDVLAGKVIVDKEGEPLTGTMPNRGAVSQALNAGGSYTIPAGYHNGSGTVAANSLVSQTSATAAAAHILNGQTAWVNGNKITGNMPNYSTTPTPIDAIRINNNRFEVAVARGFHGYTWADNGYEYMSFSQVANAIGASADKIIKGQSVCGVNGATEWVKGRTDPIGKFNIPWTNNFNTFLDIVTYTSTTKLGLLYDSVSAFWPEFKSLLLGVGTNSRGQTKMVTTTGMGADDILVKGANIGINPALSQIIVLSILRYDPKGSYEPGRLKIYGYGYNPSQFGTTPPICNIVFNGGTSIELV